MTTVNSSLRAPRAKTLQPRRDAKTLSYKCDETLDAPL
jgi:hypothetical protein